MANVKLTIAYDGSGYHGWQRQPSQPSIQQVLEEKLSLICGERIVLYGAGRTDAGVHARGQVANFKSKRRLEPQVWVRALNGLLPNDIAVLKAELAEDDFHARYAAREKHYRYRILQGALPCPFERRYSWHLPCRLDLSLMRQAAACLRGRHDFASFQAAGGRVASTVRELRQLRLSSEGRLLIIDSIGDGFLRHMVRNIVGTLVQVGRGKITAGGVREILQARDRRLAGPTAPAQGLCLMKVSY